MTIETELSREKIARLEAGAPWHEGGRAVSRAGGPPSADRAYGLVRVARCWNVSRASVYRHRQASAGAKRRPGPVGPCDATLLGHIRQAIAGSGFTGEGYRKIWARLRSAGNPHLTRAGAAPD